MGLHFLHDSQPIHYYLTWRHRDTSEVGSPPLSLQCVFWMGWGDQNTSQSISRCLWMRLCELLTSTATSHRLCLPDPALMLPRLPPTSILLPTTFLSPRRFRRACLHHQGTFLLKRLNCVSQLLFLLRVHLTSSSPAPDGWPQSQNLRTTSSSWPLCLPSSCLLSTFNSPTIHSVKNTFISLRHQKFFFFFKALTLLGFKISNFMSWTYRHDDALQKAIWFRTGLLYDLNKWDSRHSTAVELQIRRGVGFE